MFKNNIIRGPDGHSNTACSSSYSRMADSVPPEFAADVRIGLHADTMYPRLIGEGLAPSNYAEKLKAALWYEELSHVENLRVLNHIHIVKDGSFYHFRSSEAVSHEKLRFHKSDDLEVFYTEDQKGEVFDGVVIQVVDNTVHCIMNERFEEVYDGRILSCRHKLRRTPFVRYHLAIKRALLLGGRLLFPSMMVEPGRPLGDPKNMIWFNKRLNGEQQNAVLQILKKRSYAIPYVITGPPGSGKTSTLVEAVRQINLLDDTSRILVCAPTNGAADMIAIHLGENDEYAPGIIVRFNGFLRKRRPNSRPVPFCTNCIDLEYALSHKIVVSTCVTAGQFFHEEKSKSLSFSHVFIDDATSCSEPEAMIPATMMNKSNGQLILVGDPKQNGPIILSRDACALGLETSFLHRLMRIPLYCRSYVYPNTPHNPLVVTRLVEMYEMNTPLVDLLSLFYGEGVMRGRGNENVFPFCHETPPLRHILVREGYPFLFEGIKEEIDPYVETNADWCSVVGAEKVVKYAALLVETGLFNMDDIGILSSHLKQTNMIVHCLKNRLKTVVLPKVGLPEEFLGIYRKVIIISTDRPIFRRNESSLDTFFSSRGIMTMLTRARALLIIVGNPVSLQDNVYWRKVIRFAVANKAYRGCPLPEILRASSNTHRMRMTLVEREVTVSPPLPVIREDHQNDEDSAGNSSEDEEFFDCVEELEDQVENKASAML